MNEDDDVSDSEESVYSGLEDEPDSESDENDSSGEVSEHFKYLNTVQQLYTLAISITIYLPVFVISDPH